MTTKKSDSVIQELSQPLTGSSSTKRGLGRGLSALIPQALAAAGGPSASPQNRRASTTGDGADTLRYIELRSITLNPHQPRKAFGKEELEELTQSIKENGVLQPIIVRTRGDNGFELIAGERRFRAASAAGLIEIPAVVRDGLDERSSLALALIENIQREDLNAVEAAHAYSELLHTFGMTQTELALAVGKSQPQIANALRMLGLPTAIQESLKDHTISEGHAKVILSVGSSEDMLALWARIVDGGLTVRQAEAAAASLRDGSGRQPRRAVPLAPAAPDPHLAEISQRISLRMGTKVRLVPGKGERGVIEIAYYDHEQLEGLLDRLISPQAPGRPG